MQIENLLEVKIGEEIYGFDADRIEQILRVPPITPVPLSSDAVPGVCVILGKIFTIIDTGVVVEKKPINIQSQEARILSISDDTALLVSEVLDIVKVDLKNYEQVHSDDFIEGFYKHEHYVVQVLNEEKIAKEIFLAKYTPKEIDILENTKDEESQKSFSEQFKRYLFFGAYK